MRASKNKALVRRLRSPSCDGDDAHRAADVIEALVNEIDGLRKISARSGEQCLVCGFNTLLSDGRCCRCDSERLTAERDALVDALRAYQFATMYANYPGDHPVWAATKLANKAMLKVERTDG